MLLLRVGQDLVMSNRHDHGSNLNLEPLRSSSAQNRWLKPGEEIRITSPLDRTQPVPFKVKSNVMTIPSYILALDHPFAAVTDAKGRFEINGLPDGKHVFRVWHERTGYLPNIKVNIESGHVNYTTNLSVPGSRFVKKNSDEVKDGEAKGAPVKGNAEKEMQDKKAPQPSTPQVD